MPRDWKSTLRSPRIGRSFRHPSRPEFLQTLPHVHGTAGFFVARMRRNLVAQTTRFRTRAVAA